MRNLLKTLYHNNKVVYLILTPIKQLINYYRPRLLPEKIYIKRTFKNTFLLNGVEYLVKNLILRLILLFTCNMS